MCKVTYKTIFDETSFIIAKDWKQYKCPLVRGTGKLYYGIGHRMKNATTTKENIYKV